MSQLLYKEEKIPESVYDSTFKSVLGYAWNQTPKGLAFGVELEMENATGLNDVTEVLTRFIDHSDGSLRNNGLELVSRGPKDYKTIMEDLSILGKFLQANPRIDFSERTSFHVHMNFQTSTVRQIHNFLTLYYMLENLLVERAGTKRRVANHFCLRICDANRVKANIIDSFKKGSLGIMFHNERYLALNLQAYSKFGTLEFRAHRGTADVEEYKKLITALKEMYEYAHDKMRSPREIFENMSSFGFVQYFDKALPITMRYIRENSANTSTVILEEINKAMLFAQAVAYNVTVVKEEKAIKPPISTKAYYDEAVMMINHEFQPTPRRTNDVGVRVDTSGWFAPATRSEGF